MLSVGRLLVSLRQIVCFQMKEGRFLRRKRSFFVHKCLFSPQISAFRSVFGPFSLFVSSILNVKISLSACPPVNNPVLASSVAASFSVWPKQAILRRLGWQCVKMTKLTLRFLASFFCFFYEKYAFLFCNLNLIYTFAKSKQRLTLIMLHSLK